MGLLTAILLRANQRFADSPETDLYLRLPLPAHGELTQRGFDMALYGKKAEEKVKKTMHERKHGTLRSGSSGKKVTSRKQAIAIGLSEARRSGAKVPEKKT